MAKQAAKNSVNHTTGFTLIELSIVLVIIGLLVGGVLVGRDLIKSAEIRSQISQIEKFKIATNTFKLKYGSLPGDMPPSEAAANGFFTFTGTNIGLADSNKYAAYGDNDGRINQRGEIYVFWQHLSEAKLIEGQYGIGGNGEHIEANTTAGFAGTIGYPVDSSNILLAMGTQANKNIFLPQQKLTSIVYNVWVVPTMYDHDTLNLNNRQSFNNYFYIKATANESYAIDSKIDDSKPLTGSVLDDQSDSNNGASSPCSINAAPDTIYKTGTTTSDRASCTPVFLW